MLRVAEQVDENLKHLVPVHAHRWCVIIKLPDQLDVMPLKRGDVQAQGVFDQFRCLQILIDAGQPGVALLHRHDLLDMLDVLTHGVHFRE